MALSPSRSIDVCKADRELAAVALTFVCGEHRINDFDVLAHRGQNVVASETELMTQTNEV